jgi:hypothetical protein
MYFFLECLSFIEILIHFTYITDSDAHLRWLKSIASNNSRISYPYTSFLFESEETEPFST